MTKRYWIRHSSLREDIGPYTDTELRSALRAGAFPYDSEVRLEDSDDWHAITATLGLKPPAPAPASAASAARSQASASSNASEQVLAKVRADTAYAGFRLMISIVAVASILIVLITTIIALDAANRQSTGATLLILAGGCLYILLILIAAAALRALADIADCALRRVTED